MKNRNVGFLIIGIAVIIGILVLLFDSSTRNNISQLCSHGTSCGMYDVVNTQTYISFVVIFVILLIGIVLVFTKESEKLVVKKIKPYGEITPKKFSKKSLSSLSKEEAKIMNFLIENKGSLLQSEIVEKTNLNKVKITRILDSLETQNLIERKRRGMTNIVVLK